MNPMVFEIIKATACTAADFENGQAVFRESLQKQFAKIHKAGTASLVKSEGGAA
jgi:hypothetical protein